mmetsp:Transcript_1720/g.3613  ORF Transcript_1720/g.3613 Transcript_1720/m.3613 type:complete len:216 (-) Transcript_1720:1364-2011(-)
MHELNTTSVHKELYMNSSFLGFFPLAMLLFKPTTSNIYWTYRSASTLKTLTSFASDFTLDVKSLSSHIFALNFSFRGWPSFALYSSNSLALSISRSGLCVLLFSSVSSTSTEPPAGFEAAVLRCRGVFRATLGGGRLSVGASPTPNPSAPSSTSPTAPSSFLSRACGKLWAALGSLTGSELEAATTERSSALLTMSLSTLKASRAKRTLSKSISS